MWHPETPDLSECRSVWLTSLQSRVNDGDSLISIANDLSQVCVSLDISLKFEPGENSCKFFYLDFKGCFDYT